MVALDTNTALPALVGLKEVTLREATGAIMAEQATEAIVKNGVVAGPKARSKNKYRINLRATSAESRALSASRKSTTGGGSGAVACPTAAGPPATASFKKIRNVVEFTIAAQELIAILQKTMHFTTHKT